MDNKAPHRQLKDGSIDIGFYTARARQLRSEQAFALFGKKQGERRRFRLIQGFRLL
ncbi:hypothetical protein TRP8649_02103 [Pelagimonas phthalicica]|uniref:Uncharacterized protein n=1 Tax=Pelagimonas phthalicica TaxID=1037362 RepID=A0A238JBA4_9RHOB|nr:hypothetical protein [Pelagimonas phthalicica]TDS90944.1 hypothetical protein CLV87_2105 [Pelagimonas phthalicica]SMX27991.1 hypothetical protein TRP8649_02103 [Pelagimonas phthalicica]